MFARHLITISNEQKINIARQEKLLEKITQTTPTKQNNCDQFIDDINAELNKVSQIVKKYYNNINDQKLRTIILKFDEELQNIKKTTIDSILNS